VPIYDQSYRPYRGHLSSHTFRWWTITRAGIQGLLTKRPFIILLTITFIPPVVFGFMIFATHWLPEQTPVTVNAEFFRSFMEIQLSWFLILGIYPGTGLISNDLKWNAIQLYLSKPLTKLDYVAGKLAIICTFLLGVTLVPGMLLFALELGMSSDLTFLAEYWWLPFSVTAYSLIAAFGWGMIVLALSSLSKSSRFVGVLLIALVLLSTGFAAFFNGLFQTGGSVVVSAIEELKLLTYVFFGGESEYGNHGFMASVMLTVFIGISALILRSRVRAVEVVT
jgi:hypothetical protein